MVDQNEHLNKFNLSLQDQVSKYALLVTEERTEKKELVALHQAREEQFLLKIESNQNELKDRIEKYGAEKTKRSRKYLIALGVGCLFLISTIILLLRILRPELGL